MSESKKNTKADNEKANSESSEEVTRDQKKASIESEAPDAQTFEASAGDQKNLNMQESAGIEDKKNREFGDQKDDEQGDAAEPYASLGGGGKDTGSGNGDDGDKFRGKEKEYDPEKRMPFLQHLEELRWTIIRSLVSIALLSAVCYFFSRQIIEILRYPGPKDMKLIFLSPTEGFMIYIKVAIFSGLILSLPYIAYEFWKFIVPGLLEKEKKLVRPIAFYTVLCFVVGAAFAYFLIIPFGLKFLMSFQTDFMEATITIGKYIGFVVTLLLVFGVIFELPVLAFLLTHIGLLTPQFLREKRRYGIVIIFIVAAILTPPDAFTQLMLAFPLMLLYEVSIWVSAAVHKKKASRAVGV
jgi:sec-independent protein translocase protein TatC